MTGEYAFGAYTLRVPTRELLRDGEAVPVEPRVFDLLRCLIEHRDRAVSKNELQDVVWPGVIVSETALTRAVMKARRALDDHANHQQVIKTVHGHGYRFIAPVTVPLAAPEPPVPITAEPVRSPEPPPPPAPVPTAASTPARRRFLGPIAAAVLLAGGIVAAWWGWQSQRPAPLSSAPRIAVLPVENGTGEAARDWVSLALMSLIRNRLKDGGFAVLDDAQVVQLHDNLSGKADGGEQLAARLQRLYGVSHVLWMRLESNVGGLRMDYSVYPPGGGPPARSTMIGEAELELAGAVARSVSSTLGANQRRLSALDAGSGDPFVNEAYARGKGLALEGRCADALPLLEAAVAQDPTLFLPRYDTGQCLRLLGRTEEARTVFASLVGELHAPDLPSAELAQVLNAFGAMQTVTGQPDEAAITLTRSLALARAVEAPELEARALVNLAINEKNRQRLEDARKFLGEAQLAYDRAGYESPPGYVYNTLSNIAMAEGRYDDSQAYLESALEAFRAVGDRRLEAMAINNFGFLRRRQGRLDEAEPYHLQSLAIREEIGDRMGVGRIRGMLSLLYMDRAEYQRAYASAEQALAIALETEDRLFEGTALSQLGEIAWRSDDLADATARFEQAHGVFTAIGDGTRALQTSVRRARVALLDERFDDAIALATEVHEGAGTELAFAQPNIEALELLGEIAHTQGDFDTAAEHLRAALQSVSTMSWDRKRARILALLGTVELDRGQREEARAMVGQLLELPQSLQTLKVRARLAFEEGNAEQATSLMREAKDEAGAAWSSDDEKTLRRYVAATA